MSGTESSDLVSITSNQLLLTLEEVQNLTHSDQIKYLQENLKLAQAKIKKTNNQASNS